MEALARLFELIGNEVRAQAIAKLLRKTDGRHIYGK